MMLLWILACSSTTPTGALPGDGTDGENGTDGRDGTDGADGLDGANGEPGPPGPGLTWHWEDAQGTRVPGGLDLYTFGSSGEVWRIDPLTGEVTTHYAQMFFEGPGCTGVGYVVVRSPLVFTDGTGGGRYIPVGSLHATPGAIQSVRTTIADDVSVCADSSQTPFPGAFLLSDSVQAPARPAQTAFGPLYVIEGA